jgi:hypothetical protein
MQLILDEHAPMERRNEYREGKVLVLAFGWDVDQQRYMTDKREDLGAPWPEAVRKAEQLAGERVTKLRRRDGKGTR